MPRRRHPGSPEMFLALDRLDQPPTTSRETLVMSTIAWYPWILAALGILCVVRLAVVPPIRKSSIIAPLVVLMFTLSIIIPRLLFFAVIDASAWSVEKNLRYLFPIAVLVPAVPMILFCFGRPRVATLGAVQKIGSGAQVRAGSN